jgi:hypothetical protein
MKKTLLIPLLLITAQLLVAQVEGYNYDEAKVPTFILPEILKTNAGKAITNKKDWEKTRRPEILQLFEEQVFGKTPKQKLIIKFIIKSVDNEAIGGKAIKKEIIMDVANGKRQFNMLLYIPKSAKPVPVFVGLNFSGNHTVQKDTTILMPTSWVPNSKGANITDNRAKATNRGVSVANWPVELLVSRGYGLATVYCGDIDPDYNDGFQDGIHPLFYNNAQTKPAANEWGTIGAWAWGLSRMVDYLETDNAINAKQIIVTGHSRLGKAAVWAAVQDSRFAMLIANNAGEGGAAITRRKFGETIRRINTSFPHWFCGNYKQYNDAEDTLPVDFHQLLALMAPRPMYVASATEDLWSDPRGEYLSAYCASVVYQLYRKIGLTTATQPQPEQPILNESVGYHLRVGKHNILEYDWIQYMNFADKTFHK